MNKTDQEKIFTEYYDKIKYYILKKVQNYDTAEDLTSVVFLKVYEKYDLFDSSKSALSTWIYSIASNTVIDYYRTNHIAEEVPEDLSDESNIEASVIEAETLDELANALKRLPERERDLIVLHYYQKRTLKEIAELMGMSYANVKIVHNKALAGLKSYLS